MARNEFSLARRSLGEGGNDQKSKKPKQLERNKTEVTDFRTGRVAKVKYDYENEKQNQWLHSPQ